MKKDMKQLSPLLSPDYQPPFEEKSGGSADRRLATATVMAMVAVVASAGITWFTSRPATTPRVAVVTGGSGTVVLSLSGPASVNAGDGADLAVTADAGGSHVSAIQSELTYSDACGVPSVTQGTFLPNTLAGASVTGGKITFTYAAPPSSGGVTGSGTLATIHVAPTGNCTLSFTSGTQAAVTESNANALKSASDATVTIASASTPASASPSESPSAPPSEAPSAPPSVPPSTPPTPASAPSAPTFQQSCQNGNPNLSFTWTGDAGSGGYTVGIATSNSHGTYYTKPVSQGQSTDLTNFVGQSGDVSGKVFTFSLNTAYYAWVSNGKNSADSTFTVKDCNAAASASSTPAPTATPKPTATPTQRPTAKPSPTPTATSAPQPTVTSGVVITPAPTPGSLLNDIFGGSLPATDSGTSAAPNLFQKIYLGWQAIFTQIAKLIFH